MSNPLSIYIHIPFCHKKCKYCSFVSFENLNCKKEYLSALKKEILHFYKKEKLKTLYFGGGTPSVLEISEIEEIISLFNFRKNAEITFESNPESVDKKYLKNLKELGFNRLSIGIQSFDDSILKSIGRLHDSLKAKNTIKNAREAGFENISIDLIYGLPNQDMKNWEKTLKRAINTRVEHISLYGLKIDKGSYFYLHKPKNLPTDDMQADMYLKAVDMLKEFYHYEISNFAKNKKYISRHNSTYWNLSYYFGFGVAASGFCNMGRYTNEVNIKKYIQNPLVKKYENYDLSEEFIFLGLRRKEGINIKIFNEKFNMNFEEKYKKILEKYLKTGHLKKSKNCYKLTLQGALISNYILCDFLN